MIQRNRATQNNDRQKRLEQIRKEHDRIKTLRNVQHLKRLASLTQPKNPHVKPQPQPQVRSIQPQPQALSVQQHVAARPHSPVSVVHQHVAAVSQPIVSVSPPNKPVISPLNLTYLNHLLAKPNDLSKKDSQVNPMFSNMDMKHIPTPVKPLDHANLIQQKINFDLKPSTFPIDSKGLEIKKSDLTVVAKTGAVTDPTEFVGYCEWCSTWFVVPKNALNCQIFRHGVYKSDLKQSMNPHASQKECDELVASGKIYGCGKPLRFDGIKTVKCDYI